MASWDVRVSKDALLFCLGGRNVNKRIKKKRALVMSVQNLMIVCDRLMTMVDYQQKQIDELKKINSRNTEATNFRFDQIETYQKIIDDDIAELKKNKKSFFRR